MVGTMRRVAVVAGVCFLMLEGRRLPSLERIFVASAADIALLAFEQALVVAGVRSMAGNAAVFPISHKMIVRRRHLFLNIIVTLETGIDADRNIFALMTIIAAFRIGRMQDILDHRRPIAAMRAMTGSTVLHVHGKVGMFLLHGLRRVATLAEFPNRLDQQIIIGRLMGIMAGRALPFAVR